MAPERRRNFKDLGAYRRWLAYDKMHVDPGPSEHPVDVTIAGKVHHVNHCPHCHNVYGKCGAHCEK